MEYKHFFKTLISNLQPWVLKERLVFKKWVRDNSERLAYELADHILVNLPNPRVDFYKSDSYQDTQRLVTGPINQLVSDLGFYAVTIDLNLL